MYIAHLKDFIFVLTTYEKDLLKNDREIADRRKW